MLCNIIQRCDQNLKLSVNHPGSVQLCVHWPEAVQLNLILGDPLIKGTIYAKHFTLHKHSLANAGNFAMGKNLFFSPSGPYNNKINDSTVGAHFNLHTTDLVGAHMVIVMGFTTQSKISSRHIEQCGQVDSV